MRKFLTTLAAVLLAAMALATAAAPASAATAIEYGLIAALAENGPHQPAVEGTAPENDPARDVSGAIAAGQATRDLA